MGREVVSLEAKASGIDEIADDAARLAKLLEEARAIIERMSGANIRIEVAPSRRR